MAGAIAFASPRTRRANHQDPLSSGAMPSMTSCLHLLQTLHAPVLFVALDDGRVRTANAAAAHLLGYSVDALERLRIMEIECAADAEAHWQSRADGGPAEPRRTTRLRRADGRELSVEVAEIDASRDTPPQQF